MLVPLALSVACHDPLALQDSYFMPGKPNAAKHRAEALQAVRYNRALQAARQSCPITSTSATDMPGLLDRSAARRAALARLCADAPTRSVATQGGTENAYRRWIEDRTRELPETSATAAGAAGGS